MKHTVEKTKFSRTAFKKLIFPVLPYCEFGLSRSVGNEFWETYHYRNSNTGVQLNVFWFKDETVSIGVYNPRITNEFNRNKSVLDSTGNFSNQILESYCRKFLNSHGLESHEPQAKS